MSEQRRAEARLREGNRLLGHLRDANVVGVVVGTEEVVQEANDAFLDIVGYSREDLESGRITWDVITPAEWAASDADALEQLRLTGLCRPYEKEHLRRDGRRVPVLIGNGPTWWRESRRHARRQIPPGNGWRFCCKPGTWWSPPGIRLT